jgi:cell wall-associated NlpC family hydrolase
LIEARVARALNIAAQAVSSLVTVLAQEFHNVWGTGFVMLHHMIWKQLLVAVLVCSGGALAKTYTVQSGDTLYRIAQKNGISTTRLLQLNPRVGENLKVGQRLELGATQGSSQTTSPRSSSVVRVAYSKLGAGYRFGATGPYSFDCSGFTSYVMKQMGVSIPRSSRAQFNGGRAVSRTGLLPGDLVFYQGPSGRGGVGHVAVYLGNNKIIHASTPSTGVIVSSMSERYYISRYIGARRYL